MLKSLGSAVDRSLLPHKGLGGEELPEYFDLVAANLSLVLPAMRLQQSEVRGQLGLSAGIQAQRHVWLNGSCHVRLITALPRPSPFGLNYWTIFAHAGLLSHPGTLGKIAIWNGSAPNQKRCIVFWSVTKKRKLTKGLSWCKHALNKTLTFFLLHWQALGHPPLKKWPHPGLFLKVIFREHFHEHSMLAQLAFLITFPPNTIQRYFHIRTNCCLNRPKHTIKLESLESYRMDYLLTNGNQAGIVYTVHN